ncbi:MAG: radical SAM protein [Candidatus Omnitrophica bacterium]|nr:radical SAM protein [Candidatus Omnitrophota bacterium]
MKKHYTIPFFIPFQGCPNKCIFCDQNRITGSAMPDAGSVPGKIEKYLATMPDSGVRREVGFFGGSFTGISEKTQQLYLDAVRPFTRSGKIHGIRLSTRPDLIDPVTLERLSSSGVTRIELGVQSMVDDVLRASGRGHTAAHTERASRLILEQGLDLGHQIMLGLPESGPEQEMYTARRVSECGADEVRIYPVIVIRGTALADMWMMNRYSPLSLDQALDRASRMLLYFRSRSIRVIRCGLHPSEGLMSGEDYLAGPFHPSFGHKARVRAEGREL